MAANSLLSERGENTRDFPSLMSENRTKIRGNVYHPKDNPEGIIDLGIAETSLCGDILTAKMRSMDMKEYKPEYQYYSNSSGLQSFREALAHFFEKRFQAASPINPDHLLVTPGVDAALDLLAFMLCDPGDYCLVHAPYYEVISADIGARPGVKVVHAPLQKKKEDQEWAFCIDLKITEETILSALNEGHRLRMAIIINPHNPTGNILTKEEMIQLLHLFDKYKIHVVMDEIYGLSVLGDNTFTSVLSLDNLPCPEMVHFLWGFSKDFGLSGMHCGVIHSRIPSFARACRKLSNLGTVPTVIQHLLTHLITDEVWLERTYFLENKRRMDTAYEYMSSHLKMLGADVHKAKGGFFIWANLRKLMGGPTEEEEHKISEAILSGGVYCVPGTAMLCPEPGWFRLTFTHPKGYVDVGLKRLETVFRYKKKEDKEGI